MAGVTLGLWRELTPGNDDIKRFIVCHYRYDPQRRERRHVVVAGFDTEQEFRACMDSVRDQINARRERGEPVDAHEHASGTVHEPGYLRRAANGHLVSRAIRHGATGSWIAEQELSSNISVVLVVGDAWLRCRAGLADPGTFGLSQLDEAGYWWIAANLLRDVAALNSMEMLPWDIWGEMLRPDEEPDEAQIAFFDQLAALTTDPDAGFAELTARYQADPRLTVPATVYNGVLKRVDEV